MQKIAALSLLLLHTKLLLGVIQRHLNYSKCVYAPNIPLVSSFLNTLWTLKLLLPKLLPCSKIIHPRSPFITYLVHLEFLRLFSHPLHNKFSHVTNLLPYLRSRMCLFGKKNFTFCNVLDKDHVADKGENCESTLVNLIRWALSAFNSFDWN